MSPAIPIPAPASFLEAARAQGIAFDDGDLERLGRYLALLIEANRSFNLTRITEPEEAWTRHVLDSLSLLPYLGAATPGGDALRVMDVGSGGGLPGIPLAIALPAARFTLLEATGKKAAFLAQTVTALGLENVDVVNERAETVGSDCDGHRDAYDVVIARAVGPLPVLLELTVPLARVNGSVLAIKGERAGEEIAAARKALHALHAVVVSSERKPTGTVIVIEKRRPTPRIYPRRPGEPKRAPL